MLCQFSFKNFKSYKEATTFDFQATSVQEFSDAVWLIARMFHAEKLVQKLKLNKEREK